jgi:predicted nucleic acid-binding Zn ribbon protein
VVYADQFASVIVYTIIDGEIEEICRDYNPRGLKFARLESEREILAIGQDSILYHMAIESGSIQTTAAFHIGCEMSAVLNAPDLAFVTESGSLSVVMRCDGNLKKIFEAMKGRFKGIGGLTVDDLRRVRKNGKAYSLGNFVDGDFVLLFLGLKEEEKNLISRVMGKSVGEIEGIVRDFQVRLTEYRHRVQSPPTF